MRDHNHKNWTKQSKKHLPQRLSIGNAAHQYDEITDNAKIVVGTTCLSLNIAIDVPNAGTL